jgi:predicted DsbA family dithiol-disulfide isomerase
MDIDIWSDVACPWCAVGRAHLQQALDTFRATPGAPEVTVRWRSFELDPTAPKVREGDYVQRLADKYGMPRAQMDEMTRQMEARGRALGIPFDFSDMHPGNTFDAHRLLHLAHEHGVQDALKDRLFRAYFGEGAAVGLVDTLVPLAVEVGLDEAEVREVLASDRYADAVRADEMAARQMGVSGVPFFVIDRRYGVSGAQPPEVLLQCLQEARPAPAAEACGPDGCPV